MSVHVSTQASSGDREAAVVLQVPGAPDVVLSAYEARVLQSSILNAAIRVERGERALRRDKTVDEVLREREP